ncbi:MAG TPA: hypothetical protein VJS13_05080 [Pyrinomonadaceae bacterium]|nr:hypothetical protein [Pyrinomonadaceae bacterium]
MAKMTFEFLDVGMGDGTFIMMGDSDDSMNLALVDLGVHRRTKHKVGRDDAITYLVNQIDRISKARGRATPFLDHLFLTHPDHDHYNCVMLLIEAEYPSYPKKNLTIGRLTYGGDELLYKGEIEKIAAHVSMKSPKKRNIDELASNECSTVKGGGAVNPFRTFLSGKIKVYLLSSNYPTIVTVVTNPLSLCLMFADENNNKVILMGDAEKDVEAQIIENFKKATKGFLNAYALKLGHHGSQAGTSEAWINAVKPKAIFASGDFVWAHPYCTTIERVVEAKTLAPTTNHWFACGKPLGGRQNDYFNNESELRVCLNLWYVVKKEKGQKMKEDEDGHIFHAAYGWTWGVQWELEFDGDTVTLNKTDTASPD